MFHSNSNPLELHSSSQDFIRSLTNVRTRLAKGLIDVPLQLMKIGRNLMSHTRYIQ